MGWLTNGVAQTSVFRSCSLVTDQSLCYFSPPILTHYYKS
jgi:hypothetical protein